MTSTRRFGLITLLSLGLGACAAPPSGLTPADEAAIRARLDAYADAWLRDDTTAVLGTLTPGAVLLPPGKPPVTDAGAIRDFWWPRDGSRTRIRSFEWSVAEVDGRADLAFARGFSTIDWTWDQDTLHLEQVSRATNMTILRRQGDGRWLIDRQMWGPPMK